MKKQSFFSSPKAFDTYERFKETGRAQLSMQPLDYGPGCLKQKAPLHAGFMVEQTSKSKSAIVGSSTVSSVKPQTSRQVLAEPIQKTPIPSKPISLVTLSSDGRYLNPADKVCTFLGTKPQSFDTVQIDVYDRGLFRVATYGENSKSLNEQLNNGFFISKQSCHITTDCMQQLQKYKTIGGEDILRHCTLRKY